MIYISNKTGKNEVEETWQMKIWSLHGGTMKVVPPSPFKTWSFKWLMPQSSEIKKPGHMESADGCSGKSSNTEWNNLSSLRYPHLEGRPREHRAIIFCAVQVLKWIAPASPPSPPPTPGTVWWPLAGSPAWQRDLFISCCGPGEEEGKLQKKAPMIFSLS